MIPFKNWRRYLNKFYQQPLYSCSVGLRRLKAELFYSFADGRSSSPEAVTLFLTHRCNLRCKMCGQWGEGGVTKKQTTQYIQEELPELLLSAFINQVSAFRPNITLFGGEPLLYSGCLSLVRQIKEKNMHCLMITNGSLLEQAAGELVGYGLDELNISLDADKKLHEEIRGMEGLFDKIIRGVEKVQSAKLAQNKKKPLINLQCTINKYNYEHLEEMLEVAKRVKADSLTYHNLIFLNESNIEEQKGIDALLRCNSEDWKGFVFDPGINAGILAEKIKSILKTKLPFRVDYYPNFSPGALKNYYENPCYVPLEYAGRCLSPWIAAYVFPDGNVRPCLNCDYSFGNIKNNTFKTIWNSKEAVEFRRLLKSRKHFPACVRCTELYRY